MYSYSIVTASKMNEISFYSMASSRRWNHLRHMLERPGPLAHPEFEPNPEVRNTVYLRFLHLRRKYAGWPCLLKTSESLYFSSIKSVAQRKK